MLNSKERHRLEVLQRVARGEMTVPAAAQLLRLSERQLRRILAQYRKGGADALAHGNRGRRPPNALESAVRQRVVELAMGKYANCNQYQLVRRLKEIEGLAIGRSSVRRILLAEGMAHLVRRQTQGQTNSAA